MIGAVILALFLAQQAAPIPSDLTAVLEKASQYVAQYEMDLGNLIGGEEYVQNSTWLDGSTPPRVAKRLQRRTSSDFLIIQVGSEWNALRKVNRIDGSKVKEAEPNFDEAFDDSPAANNKRLIGMRDESTKQNIGDIRRDINVPTFALKVLRKNEISRFTFERSGSAKIDGIQVWTIRFKERTGPTLVSNGKGQNLFAGGTLWIEPETGRVLRTEFELENPYQHIKGQSIVTYATGKKVPMLVPTLMTERYESQYNIVECRADYLNFRPFEVDVKFEIAAPQP